jgi:hypothetical protein
MLNIMVKNKIFWTVAGFLLAGFGLAALILSLVGVQLTVLAWLTRVDRLFAFTVHLLMILGGFVAIYLAQSDFSGKDS